MTRITCSTSSAQPVTAIEPATPAVPFVGESNEPNGGDEAASTWSVTLIGPTALPAPVSVMVMEPDWVAIRPAVNCVDTVSVAVPVPEAGDTTSHGWFDAAVHVTVPPPLSIRRTTWGAVAEVNALPLLTAAKVSATRSTVIVGRVVVKVTSSAKNVPCALFTYARA